MIDDAQRPEYFEFASRVLGENYQHSNSTKCIASLKGKDISAVLIYDQTTGADCRMHIASDGSKRWLTRQFLHWAFRIPFMQWGQRRVTAIVRADDQATLRFDKSLGFKVEGRLRGAFDDGTDAILLGMLKQECRFLDEVKYGQEKH